MAHTNLAKAKMLSSTFWHVLAESILLVALGQTIAFREAQMLYLKANLLRAKTLLPKVNLLLAKALLQKAALLDWSAPGLTVSVPINLSIKLAFVCVNNPRDGITDTHIRLSVIRKR